MPKGFLKDQGAYYSVREMPDASVAFKDNKVYVSNDEEGLKMFLDKGFSKNLNNSEYADALINDVFYWNFNLDLASYPEHIITLLRAYMGHEYKIFESFVKIYKAFEYKIQKDNRMEFVLKMQSESNNSLKVILKNLDENIPSIIRGM